MHFTIIMCLYISINQCFISCFMTIVTYFDNLYSDENLASSINLFSAVAGGDSLRVDVSESDEACAIF